jgi:hypothetical protein
VAFLVPDAIRLRYARAVAVCVDAGGATQEPLTG